MFMDATCVSPVSGDGRPKPKAADEDGAAVAEAERKNREEDYPDVEASPHACLVSLGVETYGRWNPHSQQLLTQLARKKARGVAEELRRTTERAYMADWWSLLAVALPRKGSCRSGAPGKWRGLDHGRGATFSPSLG